MKTFKKGFTFLEIMIAVGIFGIVSIVCITNYLICLKEIKIVNDKIKMVILAEQKIEELKLKNEEIKEEEGNFNDPDSDYIWEIKLSDIVIYDTEENIELIPYKLTIKSQHDYYSLIIPFLKMQEKNE
ncbi:MAG TPA: prepilin-type N-terminal cleavage/methylation domain-containing protein [bacterium]|nr:prepilin-type N-terminal cleavage/methylation domain-containing protein [bacterium]